MTTPVLVDIYSQLRSARVIQLLSLAESLRKLINTPLISTAMLDAGEVTLEQSREVTSHVEEAVEHLVAAIRILGQKGLHLGGQVNIDKVNAALTTLGVPPTEQ